MTGTESLDLPAAARELPAAVRDLLTDLRILDHNTEGRPNVPPQRRALAVEWLERVLVDTEARIAHIELLQKLCGGKFVFPAPRHDWIDGQPPAREPAVGFHHDQLLPEDRAEAIAMRGVREPNVLSDAKLAELLLNPVALCDVADLIDALWPDYWVERIEAMGRETMGRLGIKIEIPRGASTVPPDSVVGAAATFLYTVKAAAPTAPRGAGCWVIGFADDAAAVRRRIAEHAFGDPERPFEILVYRLPVPGRTDLVQAQLEIEPVPTKNDLDLTVEFRCGGSRRFRLEVPPELRRDPTCEPRPRTRTAPSDPLPAAAFDLQGGSEWRDNAWPAELILRSAGLGFASNCEAIARTARNAIAHTNREAISCVHDDTFARINREAVSLHSPGSRVFERTLGNEGQPTPSTPKGPAGFGGMAGTGTQGALADSRPWAVL